jgi:hypothetical protein
MVSRGIARVLGLVPEERQLPLADLVTPYEFESNHGPPLSEWERSEAATTQLFRDLFPDGVVPIRYVPTLGVDAETALEWAEQVLSVFEAAHAYDLDRVDDLASQWYLLFEEIGMREHWDGANGVDPVGAAREATLQSGELTRVTRELMALGLSMRALARYLHVLPHHVARAYVGGRDDMLTKVLAADDLVGDLSLSAPEIAARTGYSAAAVKRLRRARGIEVPRGPRKKALSSAA